MRKVTAGLLFVFATTACSDPASPGSEPAPPVRASAVVGGEDYACALLPTGTVQCNGALESVSGFPRDLVSIAGGEQHACGITAAGAVRCWGVNTHGRLLVPAGSDFRAAAPGTFHSCALRSSGAVDCWGHDDLGQATPPRASIYRAIASSKGGHFSCALTVDGEMTCWGAATAHPAGSGWTNLSLTSDGGCARRDGGDLACWGASLPPAIPGSGVSDFSAGRDFVCLIRNGRVECAGGAGAVVQGVPEGEGFVQIGAGYRHACALRSNGTVACWGSMTVLQGVAS